MFCLLKTTWGLPNELHRSNVNTVGAVLAGNCKSVPKSKVFIRSLGQKLGGTLYPFGLFRWCVQDVDDPR